MDYLPAWVVLDDESVMRGGIASSQAHGANGGIPITRAVDPDDALLAIKQPDGAHATLNGKTTNGPFAYTNFWWSNPESAALTGPATAVVTANVSPGLWSDWNGQFGNVDPETTAAFQAAAADPDLVGLSYRGGCFFENGVGVRSGSATFRLISDTIQ